MSVFFVTSIRVSSSYLCVCSFSFFFFKQKTAYEMRISDWSSDVCSSDLHRPFCVLSRCGRDGLLQPQGSTAALRVMFNHRLHAWRASLLIPEPELCEVNTATILHGAHEILASDGLHVMPTEIKVSALAETIRPPHQRHHTEQFSAFVVYSGCVEIRDFNIGFRPMNGRETE